jgi:2,3-dihydroxybiphenyl 1,2-dioxygenase
LAYLGISSPATEAWRAFGPELLGLECRDIGADGTVYLRVDDRHHRLAIHPAETDGVAYIGWETQHARAFDAAVAHVSGHGVDVVAGTAEELADRAVRGMAWFRDLIGMRHELCWGQLDEPRSWRPGRAHGGFVTDEFGLGHVVFIVPDIAEATTYYERIFQLTLTDVIDAHLPLAFFHTNQRNHSLALGEGTRGPGLLHLMIQVRHLDDLGLAYDRCQVGEVPIKRTIGRHPNDRVVSFYLGTPSGFDIEYGWGGVDVEPGRHVATGMKTASIWGHKFLGDLSVLPPA